MALYINFCHETQEDSYLVTIMHEFFIRKSWQKLLKREIWRRQLFLIIYSRFWSGYCICICGSCTATCASFLMLFFFLFPLKPHCRNLREMFKIDAADYMMSICGNDALRELSSPGKSGSVFFLSQDDRFMIKTLRKSEVQVCHLYWTFFRLCMLLLVTHKSPLFSLPSFCEFYQCS